MSSSGRRKMSFGSARARLFDSDDEDVPMFGYGDQRFETEPERHLHGRMDQKAQRSGLGGGANGANGADPAILAYAKNTDGSKHKGDKCQGGDSVSDDLGALLDAELAKMAKKPGVMEFEEEWEVADSDEDVYMKKSIDRKSYANNNTAVGGVHKSSGFGVGVPAAGTRPRRTELTSIFSPTAKTGRGIYSGSVGVVPTMAGPSNAVAGNLGGSPAACAGDDLLLSPDGHGADFERVAAGLKLLSQVWCRTGSQYCWLVFLLAMY